jgi:hypothetical protein
MEQQGLTTKQRLCLFHGSEVTAEDALAMEDSNITYTMLIEKGIKANNITAAGIGPSRLYKMGMENASQMRVVGFDALYLADPKFATEANLSFGSDDVKDAFLKGASDAVSVAGTDAMELLGMTVVDLMTVCAGAPTEAQAVLQQLPLGTSLEGVSASTILDTGLRKAALMELGYSLTSIAQQTKANATELAKLGYSL